MDIILKLLSKEDLSPKMKKITRNLITHIPMEERAIFSQKILEMIEENKELEEKEQINLILIEARRRYLPKDFHPYKKKDVIK